MKSLIFALSLVLAPGLAGAAPPLPELAAQVSEPELQATITRLVAFGTRHTLSDTQSETRGIGAARRWVKSRFDAVSRDCGGCLQVVTPAQTFAGERRIPNPTEVMNVVAIQRGTEDPERVIVITGHVDSINSDVMDAVNDAPGANDDASGVAAVIEAARILSKHKFRATIVYGVLSGEEQGLFGGKVIAVYAKAQGWRVEADLNNDIVGNSRGGNGVHDNSTVRVFSEGTKALETAEQANRRRYNGGEVDSPSRNVARFVERMAQEHLTNLKVMMVYRTDRFGRGGDEVEFVNAGFPAVRITEANENYTRQHQTVRMENGVRYGDTIDGVDFAYLAQVTRLNVVSLAALAAAPAPPKGVAISGAVSPDTTIKWQPVNGAASYRVWWRSTTDSQWRHHRDVPANATLLVLKNVAIDDWFFGVSAVSADGFDESPVVFPGDAGSF